MTPALWSRLIACRQRHIHVVLTATLRYATLRYATLPVRYINNNITLCYSPCNARREAQRGSAKPPGPPAQWAGEDPVSEHDERFAERSLTLRNCREPASERGGRKAKLSRPPCKGEPRERSLTTDDENVKPARTTSGGEQLCCSTIGGRVWEGATLPSS